MKILLYLWRFSLKVFLELNNANLLGIHFKKFCSVILKMFIIHLFDVDDIFPSVRLQSPINYLINNTSISAPAEGY